MHLNKTTTDSSPLANSPLTFGYLALVRVLIVLVFHSVGRLTAHLL